MSEISPFLTVSDLARRWPCTNWNVYQKYAALGLKPLRIGKNLLFAPESVEDAERRATAIEAAE